MKFEEFYRVHTLEVFKFHDYFHDLFKFSMTFGLAVTFENFQNVPCFRIYFLTLNSSTDTNSSVYQNGCRSPSLITPLDLKLSLLCHLQ